MLKYVNVYIADDDPEDRLIISDCLKAFFPPERLIFAEDGTLLLEMLQAPAANSADIIILDLNMPKLNGIETLRQLKALPDLQQVPVLILSTSMNPVQKNECMSLGAAHYLVKPCSYNEMLELGAFISGFAKDLLMKNSLIADREENLA